MVRTTSSLPESACLRPLCNNPAHSELTVIRIGRQAVCDIVDDYEDVNAINGGDISHRSICRHWHPKFLPEKFRRFKNPHITKSLNCYKVIPILSNYRGSPTPRACCYQSIEGQTLRDSWTSRGNLPLLTRHGSDGIAWMSE